MLTKPVTMRPFLGVLGNEATLDPKRRQGLGSRGMTEFSRVGFLGLATGVSCLGMMGACSIFVMIIMTLFNFIIITPWLLHILGFSLFLSCKSYGKVSQAHGRSCNFVHRTTYSAVPYVRKYNCEHRPVKGGRVTF